VFFFHIVHILFVLLLLLLLLLLVLVVVVVVAVVVLLILLQSLLYMFRTEMWGIKATVTIKGNSEFGHACFQ